jgi:ABC-2 type transport system permease protein
LREEPTSDDERLREEPTTVTNTNRFDAGTFTPDPRPATVPKMLAAQFGLELRLLLRNGEQLLLTMFIPITLLVGLTLLPLGSFGDNRAATFVPAIMALAVISTAFTGQAIAVAFDRRYGALKRLGATALPVWGIIAGKSLAVVTVVFLQSMLLGAIGFALGWRPALAGLALGGVVIALGTAAFAALGLLLGGTLRAEIVLALANLLWFVFAGLGALTLEGGLVSGVVRWIARLTPSGALAESLTQAMTLSVDWFGLAVLAVWGVVAALCALRWFRFT